MAVKITANVLKAEWRLRPQLRRCLAQSFLGAWAPRCHTLSSDIPPRLLRERFMRRRGGREGETAWKLNKKGGE